MAIGLEKGKICGVCVCLGRKGYCMRHSLRQVIAPQSLLHRDGETPESLPQGSGLDHWQLTFILGCRLPVIQHFPLASACEVSVLEIEVPLAWDDY